MITRQRKRLVATLAIVLAVAAIVAVTASLCTGGNDRDDRDSVPPTPQQILARPPHYDARTLDDYAAAVRLGRTDFDDNAMAHMVMLCQASIDRLGNITDVLVANEDPADSYNTLKELGETTWVRDTALLLRFLRTATKNQDLINRLGQLSSACIHINTSVHEIYQNQLGGNDLHIVLPM
ncbi:MAG: hypothetical protein MR822_04775 [Bacteroidales bacterium]|jgi:hypothetical protein|nr:hypothetical protein [Bacteroidales bacterium]